MLTPQKAPLFFPGGKIGSVSVASVYDAVSASAPDRDVAGIWTGA
jgi:hypothetical protein